MPLKVIYWSCANENASLPIVASVESSVPKSNSPLTTLNLGTLGNEQDSTLATIGNEAFFNAINLTYLVIPALVTSIGEGAFWTSNLVLVFGSIPGTPGAPERILTIGNEAFHETLISAIRSGKIGTFAAEWQTWVKGTCPNSFKAKNYLLIN